MNVLGNWKVRLFNSGYVNHKYFVYAVNSEFILIPYDKKEIDEAFKINYVSMNKGGKYEYIRW